MNIEVLFTPAEYDALAGRDLSGCACVVFDVLRATSVFVTALHRGAAAIVPVASIPEALTMRQKMPDALLAGERDGLRIRAAQTGGIDFDLGNSPHEYTPGKVRGKTIVSTTTNGTRALRACASATTVLASSFLNLGATAVFLERTAPERVLAICAGTGEGAALEDALAAGALCELVVAENEQVELSDSARIAMASWVQAKSDLTVTVCESKNASRLLAMPGLRDDVAFCLQRDIHPLIARMDVAGRIECV